MFLHLTWYFCTFIDPQSRRAEEHLSHRTRSYFLFSASCNILFILAFNEHFPPVGGRLHRCNIHNWNVHIRQQIKFPSLLLFLAFLPPNVNLKIKSVVYPYNYIAHIFRRIFSTFLQLNPSTRQKSNLNQSVPALARDERSRQREILNRTISNNNDELWGKTIR